MIHTYPVWSHRIKEFCRVYLFGILQLVVANFVKVLCILVGVISDVKFRADVLAKTNLW